MSVCIARVSVCMRACVRTCVRACVRARVCTYACTYQLSHMHSVRMHARVCHWVLVCNARVRDKRDLQRRDVIDWNKTFADKVNKQTNKQRTNELTNERTNERRTNEWTNE